jgi:hypothetical protein
MKQIYIFVIIKKYCILHKICYNICEKEFNNLVEILMVGKQL